MDIMALLKSAQTVYNSQQQDGHPTNNSVATFFNQCAGAPTQPIPIQIQQNMTLESIERNLPAKISPPNLDTHNNNHDLANSPLAKFLNASNYNAPPPKPENGSNGVILVSGSKGLVPPGFNTTMPPPMSNGTKETKLITPAMLTSNASNNNGTAMNGSSLEKKMLPEPLNKIQLVQALKFLIDNDEDFTKKIHDAYVKSLKSS
jgi:hypothetical protein